MSVRRQDCDSDAEYERIKRFDESLPDEAMPNIKAIKMPDDTWRVYAMDHPDGPVFIGRIKRWEDGRLIFGGAQGAGIYTETLAAIAEVMAGLEGEGSND